ncbi:UDP-2,3-diacylglucosamine diphosphatase [Comamonas serinivorans]|uniref:UDP-2,3-diacylglucosamine hydrolase n=1 Tax=Comamonas serinivorans TaxID=1082851 RepID=A0A1Y0ELK4_9BURK|nr:UDP-2,3-diacylglucosamine diphosphatase [Comamonas serinivorans]ARU04487.1 UDP-2,3-diacylglucosamine diphosphatase [Comamonas serinivorans]
MPHHDRQHALPRQSRAACRGWRCIDFLSDLHLHEGDDGAATAQAFAHYLQHTPADAVFLLGDVFEVWVGDDAATPGSFEARVAAQIRALSQRAAVHFMAGNRDFLLGPTFLAQAGLQGLHDPTCLDLGAGQRWLLTHGDAWCLDDVDYQRFRTQVRTPTWQAALLAKPLAERQAIARAMRQASASKQADMLSHADVDTATAQAALAASDASVLLHGHTHRPAEHALAPNREPATGQPIRLSTEQPATPGVEPGPLRIVLSDWDLQARPPRADVIRLMRDTPAAAPAAVTAAADTAGAQTTPGWTWQRISLTQGGDRAAALFGVR